MSVGLLVLVLVCAASDAGPSDAGQSDAGRSDAGQGVTAPDGSVANRPGPPPTAAPLTFDPQLVLEELDELWARRDEPQASKRTDELVGQVLARAPRDYELLWRAARHCWWTADGLPQGAQRKQLARDGMGFAERARAAYPGGAQGNYYYALNVGAYSQAIGVLGALAEGLEPKFLGALDAALAANEAFDRHGGVVAKGRYHYELPWPARNLGKARDELKRAHLKSPEHLRALLYLAEVELADGKPAAAREAVEQVLAGRSTYDPPEAARIKAWAKPLAQELARIGR